MARLNSSPEITQFNRDRTDVDEKTSPQFYTMNLQNNGRRIHKEKEKRKTGSENDKWAASIMLLYNSILSGGLSM